MEIIKFEQLNHDEQKLVDAAMYAAEKSITGKKNFVGSAILGSKGGVFGGATIARTRAIGSTCSERMALDQLYFDGNEIPKIICTIGTFERAGWENQFICTPCGVCLEMLLECTKHFGIDSLNLICSSWDKSKILKCTLDEIFPQVGKGKWQRCDTTTL